MIDQQEPRVLTLLRNSTDVTIDGDLHVDAGGPAEFVRWVRALPHPAAFAWRSVLTGERRLQLSGSIARKPVRGRVTVVLDGDRHRGLWDALLDDDLSCGGEEPIDVERIVLLAWSGGDRRDERVPAA